MDDSWLPLIKKAYKDCPDFKAVTDYPELHNSDAFPDIQVNQEKEGQLTIFKIVKDGTRRLWIPRNCRQQTDKDTIKELRKTLLQETHNTLIHGSGEKTFYYLQDYFFWPKMRKDTMDYCQQCDTCQYTMYSTKAPQGLARPIPIPSGPLTHLCMDFLSLPPKIRKENGQDVIYNTIWVIVDRHSNYTKLISVNKEITSEKLCQIYETLIKPDWGYPQDIISDRDTRLTAKPWTEYCKKHKIHQSLSTAYHPRSDGQTVVANKAIVQKIRHMNYDGTSNWLENLPNI